MWMVRAGRGGDSIEVFLSAGLIGFGGAEVDAVAAGVSKEELVRLYREAIPHVKEGSRAAWASQLLRLRNEFKVGDKVVTFDADLRRYYIGEITGEYRFDGATPGRPSHVRAVKWTAEAERDALMAATRNTLGSTLTVFRLNAEASADLIANSHPRGEAVAPVPNRAADPEGFVVLTDDTLSRANEFIEDLINQLAWDEMEELVAGVLRAMGYRTTVSPPGPDRGVDIFASPDGLGLEEPRIFVEVKHRGSQMGSKEIRSFVGGRRKGDKCLYVSTSGFSKDAHYEAERAEVAIQLIGLNRLRELVVDYYEKLDPETRALVPLKRFYWPVPREVG